MRIQVKGGVWKNSEDEVLKAAVMKYGLNNWSRVASLLVRKSSKQCKARWYEWLSPYVRKTEWTREEEEKLLHLAKLFPTQWRTIAPLIGRTAYQCLEHYEKLLDKAQGRDTEDGYDPRKFKPGEIDPFPETKPSMADPVDMDDDEKEMLAEARARLANTHGKKAKRKAREKMLEHTRRLAGMQKRRELLAAGITTGMPRLKKIRIDYEKEVPLEQKPPIGFYPVGDDEKPELDLATANAGLVQFEAQRRDDEMAKYKKDDLRKLKRLQEENLPAALEIFEKNNPFSQMKRSKLLLPEPQITNDEMVEIVKMGVNVSNITAGLDDSATVASFVPPRTPLKGDAIMSQARNAALMNSMQTPLEGGENPMLSEPPTPMESTRTPNIIGQIWGSTPFGSKNSISGTPFRGTPFRDNESVITDMDPIGAKARLDMARLHVRASIANLPAPTSEIEIDLPNVQLPEVKKEEEIDKGTIKELKSSAIQLNLPRPLIFNSIVIENPFNKNTNPEAFNIEKEISDEMIKLLANDSIVHPQKGSVPAENAPELDEFDSDIRENALEILQSEYKKFYDHQLNEGPSMDLDLDQWLKAYSNIGYSTALKKYCFNKSISDRDRLESSRLYSNRLLKHVKIASHRCTQLEKRYVVYTRGYMAKVEELESAIDSLHENLANLRRRIELAKSDRYIEFAEVVKTRELALLESEEAFHSHLQSKYRMLKCL